MKTKICPKCGESNPDRFYPGKAKCKTCLAAYKRDLRDGIRHPLDKPDKKICRECSKSEDEAAFKKTANICIPCHNAYLKEYRKKNRAKLSKQTGDWKKTNRERVRHTNRKRYATEDGKSGHMARLERTYRSWLSKKMSTIKSIAAKPGPHDPKSGPKRNFDIDLDYVIGILEKQECRCAILDIDMDHKNDSIRSASIDRIDSAKGHVRGNIQIVCQCINRMKNTNSNMEVGVILNDYFNRRVASMPLASLKSIQFFAEHDLKVLSPEQQKALTQTSIDRERTLLESDSMPRMERI